MALLAQFLALDGNLSEAITWFEHALELNPNDVNIRLNFADTLSQGGRYGDAELQYKRVLEIDPNNLEATFYLGDLYQFWQPTPRYSEAAIQYQKVIAMAPDSVLAERASRQLVVMGYATPVPATPVAAATPMATPAIPMASNQTGS
jgi:tetratricopeptide (TPR) repeat protein